MSAFMCSDKHIATLARWRTDVRFSGVQYQPRSSVEMAHEAYAMAKLNSDALAARYGESVREPVPPAEWWEGLILSLDDKSAPVDAAAYAKLAGCFLYQCTEGEDLETRDVYKLYEGAERAALKMAAGRAYESAPWGIH